MAGSSLKIDIRRSRILERLKREGAVFVAQLANELNTTPVTIRSDLKALEQEGYLVRVQGGAVRKPRKTESLSVGKKDPSQEEEKQRIALEVSGRIRNGDTLFINSGTTMEYVAAALSRRKHLNIVTNALAVAIRMGKIPTFRVILLGGEINAQYGFTYGSDAQEQLSHYQADWAVVTMNGISAAGGMTTYHAEEANINRMMIAQAKQTMVAADHSKIGRAGFFRFGDAITGIRLVTDSGADPRSVAELERCGVAVTCVEV